MVTKEFQPRYDQSKLLKKSREINRDELKIWSMNLMVVNDLQNCTFQPQINKTKRNMSRDIGQDLYDRGQDKHEQLVNKNK